MWIREFLACTKELDKLDWTGEFSFISKSLLSNIYYLLNTTHNHSFIPPYTIVGTIDALSLWKGVQRGLKSQTQHNI